MNWVILLATVSCYAVTADARRALQAHCLFEASCLTCENANSKEHCEAIGEMKKCKGIDAVCEVVTHYNPASAVDQYSSRCRSPIGCNRPGNSPPAGKCQNDNDGSRRQFLGNGMHSEESCRHCEPAACTGECTTKGDPHVNTLDGFKIQGVQSECGVTLVRDGCIGGIPVTEPEFQVAADIDKKPGTVKYFVRKIAIEVQTDTSSQYLKFSTAKFDLKTIDGTEDISGYDRTNPLIKGGTKIYLDEENKVVVKLAIGVVVVWDFDAKVTVQVPEHFSTKTCGVCGNFNGVASDDMIFGPKSAGAACPRQAHIMESVGAQRGHPATNGDKDHEVAFASSWFNYAEPNDPACQVECYGP